jgi:hypothetical protein
MLLGGRLATLALLPILGALASWIWRPCLQPLASPSALDPQEVRALHRFAAALRPSARVSWTARIWACARVGTA